MATRPRTLAERALFDPPPYKPEIPARPRPAAPVAPDVLAAYHELGSRLTHAAVDVESAVDQATADRRRASAADAGCLVGHARPLIDRLAGLLANLSAVDGLSDAQASRVRTAAEHLRSAAGELAGLGVELAPSYPFEPITRG